MPPKRFSLLFSPACLQFFWRRLHALWPVFASCYCSKLRIVHIREMVEWRERQGSPSWVHLAISSAHVGTVISHHSATVTKSCFQLALCAMSRSYSLSGALRCSSNHYWLESRNATAVCVTWTIEIFCRAQFAKLNSSAFHAEQWAFKMVKGRGRTKQVPWHYELNCVASIIATNHR